MKKKIFFLNIAPFGKYWYSYQNQNKIIQKFREVVPLKFCKWKFKAPQIYICECECTDALTYQSKNIGQHI